VVNFKEEKKINRIIITSALPYANGPIHIGHLVEYIQTDIFVRFLKLIGKNAVYCCADDTHGTPIEIKAKELGIRPEDLIRKVYKEHINDFRNFLINFDSYYTTHSKENKYFSDLIFHRLIQKRFIYTKEIESSYCENCKRFLPDRYIKGKCPKCNAENQYGDVCEKCNATYKTTDLIEPYCIICKNKPVRKSSLHYFFKLSYFSFQLKDWLDNNKNLQSEIKNYVYNWIKSGLEDWDISRDGPYFGFKIPNEENKYYYVWLDAPIGYIASFSNFLNKNVKKTENEWNNAEIIHFVGKDIIYFHFLFWPAILMGSGFNLPSNIFVHGFLTVDGEKMSKSRGTFFTANEFLERYNNPEFLRYYYAKLLSKRMSDIDLSFKDFNNTINNELVANIANFCYRTLSFLDKNFDREIKELDNNKIIKEIDNKIRNIKENYGLLNFNDVVKDILFVSSIGNKYFQDNEPWKLVKKEKEKTHKILGLCVNIVRNLSILLGPILPNFSAELQKQLGEKDLRWKDINFEFKNRKLNKTRIILNRIEEKEVKIQKQEFPIIMRVGKILSAKAHPNADKLIIVEVDLGKEKRQIVAGIRAYYKIEDLIGKKIIIVTNLKWAKLRGIESQGMLLAACNDDESVIEVLTVKDSSIGNSVYFDGLESVDKEISLEEFLKIKMIVKKGKVVFKDKILKTDKEEIIVEKVRDGARVR
jgi:methionyl-tRNA synthetase